MNEVSENEKKSLGRKLLEFQKMGLGKHGSYLVDQLEFASMSESRAAYKRYVEKELDMNKKKIASTEAKLNERS